MLLTITTTHHPATDLGYLVHKHPDRFQSFDLSFGNPPRLAEWSGVIREFRAYYQLSGTGLRHSAALGNLVFRLRPRPSLRLIKRPAKLM